MKIQCKPNINKDLICVPNRLYSIFSYLNLHMTILSIYFDVFCYSSFEASIKIPESILKSFKGLDIAGHASCAVMKEFK